MTEAGADLDQQIETTAAAIAFLHRIASTATEHQGREYRQLAQVAEHLSNLARHRAQKAETRQQTQLPPGQTTPKGLNQ